MNKSPLNYIGNKYQILDQLLPLFPKDINTFIDLFMGGGDVITNIEAKEKIGIDINTYLTDILQALKDTTPEDTFAFIEKRIDEFNLTKENELGYLKYRDAYNTNPTYHTPLDLYTLSRFSFHFTIRFNSDLQMNAGFGRGFSNFSSRQRKTIKPFQEALQDIEIRNIDFRNLVLNNFKENDFIYADPPYLITNNVYNNGLKLVGQKWNEKDEKDLLAFLDTANSIGIKFTLSNVLHHRGKTNKILEEWLIKNEYNVHKIETSYSHCTHTVDQKDPPSLEIVVTNY